MEKFRHFGDAATGIHPFTFVVSPTSLGRAAATVMFPIRLLFSSVFVLLLLLTDTLLWLLHTLCLGLLGRLLLGPLQRAWLRGLLFFVGHILPERPVSIGLPTANGSANNSGSSSSGSSPRSVPAGALVVCNCQSVWDGAVLEVMLAQPFHACCFPDQRVGGATPGLRVFWPGPLQRWQVWNHVRQTGRLDFLESQQHQPSSSAAAKKSDELMLHAVQDAAAKAGVPVWWFAEGTCSNGKGLLPMPPVTCRAAAAAAAADCSVFVATIQYDSPALQSVLGSDVEGFFGLVFRTSVLLYGSTAPAWSSPFFPTAEVTFRPVRLTRAVALEPAASGEKKSQGHKKDAATYWVVGGSAVQELRNAMCQRGQALVVSGGGSGAAVRRQPLSVGMKEKKGFVEAYTAMLQRQ